MPSGPEPWAMFDLLQQTVQPGVVNAAGWILGVGGLLLTALWWRRLVD